MEFHTIMDWLNSKTALLPTWARLLISGLVGAGIAVAYTLGWISV